jgi:transposase
MKNIAYVGIDYHQAFLAVVVLPEGESQPVDKVKLENDPKKIKKYMSKLSKRYEIKTCYEASSCGYFFYRQMASWGYPCEVIAPSKIPQKPGDHVKTDFKDAELSVSISQRFVDLCSRSQNGRGRGSGFDSLSPRVKRNEQTRETSNLRVA